MYERGFQGGSRLKGEEWGVRGKIRWEGESDGVRGYSGVRKWSESEVQGGEWDVRVGRVVE